MDSLVSRLGHSITSRLMIINCDDLGVSHAANIATYNAMTHGIATSATLMVPCPWAREAADMFSGMNIGVHLTMTSEYRVYRWRGLTRGASPHDQDGFLPASAQSVLERITKQDAHAECRAQIETALSWGLDITHLDTHMDIIWGRPDLFDVYLDLAAAFRIPIRMEATAARCLQAAEHGVMFPDHFIYPWPRRTRDVFFEEVPRLAPGVTEIFAHPVIDGTELRAYDLARFTDIRVHDASCMTDPTVAGLLDQHGVRRISFRELRTLQRAS